MMILNIKKHVDGQINMHVDNNTRSIVQNIDQPLMRYQKVAILDWRRPNKSEIDSSSATGCLGFVFWSSKPVALWFRNFFSFVPYLELFE